MDINILVQQFCDYSSYIKGYSPATVRRYRQNTRMFIHHAAITEIEQVNIDNVRNYFYQGRAQKNWTPNAFITYHKTLNVFFRWCVERKYLTTNPIIEVEQPKLNKRLPTKLTKQNALKLLEIVYNFPYPYTFLRYRNHAIFATFLFTGLRRKELLNLKYTDIDLENLSLFVRQGKGGKDRIIPISYTLSQSLNRYLSERKRLKKTCPEFFTSLNRNLGFTDNGLKRLVEGFQKSTNIPFTIHKLRHTFATLMLEGGCDIYSLAKMMGHSDIKTTTLYLAASAEHLREQITKHPLNSL